MRWLLSYSVLSRLLGMVLLLAGAATAYDALEMAGSFRSIPLLEAGRGMGEIIFGLWLLVGLYPQLSWWLLAGCFILFIGVSFDRAIAGESSCGCFGRFLVDPWFTFAFDAAAIVALALVQPSTESSGSRTGVRRRCALFASAVLMAFVVLGVIPHTGNAQLGDDGELIGTGNDVLLSPQDWIGRRFPLTRHIDIGPSLMDGRWALMFYRPDCSVCRTALAEFVGLAYQLNNQDSSMRLALIEVPKEGVPPSAGLRQGICRRGFLSAERRWRMRAPTFVLLDRGTVVKVADQLNSLYRDLGVAETDDQEEGGKLFPDYRKIRRERFLKEIACGPLALIRVLQDLGKPLSEEEAESLVDEAGDKGIDMLRLKELAEQYSVHALGVAISPDGLRHMGQRAIVFMDGVGFVPVLGYTKDGFVVAYPLAPAGVLPDDLFARSFGKEGKALLLSDKPLVAARLGISDTPEVEKPSGPRLQAARSIIAVGRLHRKDWEASLTLSNDGSEALEIKEIKTDCSCFQAWVDRKRLAPGDSTQLRAKGTQNRSGGFRYAVTIETNGSEGSPLRIPVRGYLEPPVAFHPPNVYLREILARETADAEVKLVLPRQLNWASLIVTAPKDGSFTAEVVPGDPDPAIRVHWAGTKQPGIHRGEILVRGAETKDAVAATLPCAVEVVPEITVFPPSLYIEEPVGNPWTRRLSLESRRDLVGTPSFRWSDEATGNAIQTELTKEGARLLRVSFRGKALANREGSALTISIGPQSVSVPIRFLPILGK
jgi:hypothetical protein